MGHRLCAQCGRRLHPIHLATGRADDTYKGRIRFRDQPRRHCDKLHSASLWFNPCSQQCNTPRQSVVAAALITTRRRNLMLHGAIHAHMTHGLVTARSAVPAGGIPHLAMHTGECRLRCEKRDHNNGDELEDTFHPIQLNHSRNTPYM